MSKKNTQAEVVTEEIVTSAPAPLTPLAKQEAYAEFSEHGEVMTASDLILERYLCVQGMTRDKNKYGLREGMFYGNLSKKGFEKAIVLPIHETQHIVEKINDNTNKFVADLPLDHDRVKKAYKANNNSYINLLSVDRDPPTKLVETYDVHVVFLAEDGLTPLHFGILQFHSTNLFPRKFWKSERQSGGRSHLAPYFFRSVVSCETKHNTKSNSDSMIFKIEPFAGKWDAAMLNPTVPVERDLLLKCKAHRDLISAGQFKVSYEDEEVSETDAEDAEFSDADDSNAAVNEAPNF